VKNYGRHQLFAVIFLVEEEFEDTKGTIRIRLSKKNRKHNGQEKKVQKDKQRSTKHAYKTKDRVTIIPYIFQTCAAIYRFLLHIVFTSRN
jgi:hypothetical protein